MKLSIEDWAYVLGLPSLIYITGNIHHPSFLPAKPIKIWRGSPLLSYITPSNGTLTAVPYCLLADTCIIISAFSRASPWLPLGDGAQLVPMFYQVAVPMEKKRYLTRL